MSECYTGAERRSSHDEVNRKLDRILECLDGDDTESKPGLRIRVDRLTQAKKRQDWLHATWFAALVTWLINHFGRS